MTMELYHAWRYWSYAVPDYDEVMLHLIMMMEVMLLLICMIMMNDGVNDDEGE